MRVGNGGAAGNVEYRQRPRLYRRRRLGLDLRGGGTTETPSAWAGRCASVRGGLTGCPRGPGRGSRPRAPRPRNSVDGWASGPENAAGPPRGRARRRRRRAGRPRSPARRRSRAEARRRPTVMLARKPEDEAAGSVRGCALNNPPTMCRTWRSRSAGAETTRTGPGALAVHPTGLSRRER